MASAYHSTIMVTSFYEVCRDYNHVWNLTRISYKSVPCINEAEVCAACTDDLLKLARYPPIWNTVSEVLHGLIHKIHCIIYQAIWSPIKLSCQALLCNMFWKKSIYFYLQLTTHTETRALLTPTEFIHLYSKFSSPILSVHAYFSFDSFRSTEIQIMNLSLYTLIFTKSGKMWHQWYFHHILHTYNWSGWQKPYG